MVDFQIQRSSMYAFGVDITDKEEECKLQHMKIESMQKDFNAHISDVHDQITATTEELVARVRDQEKSLHAELVRHQIETNKELERLKICFARIDNIIAKTREQIANVNQPMPKLPSVGLHKADKLVSYINWKTSEIERKMRMVRSEIKDCAKCTYIPQTSPIDLGLLLNDDLSLLMNTTLDSDILTATTSGSTAAVRIITNQITCKTLYFT